MDFSMGDEYIRQIKSGMTETDLILTYGIEIEELYAVVAYCNQRFASEKLEHFCRGCANDLCFSWPMRDETPCPVRGYELKCPLKR